MPFQATTSKKLNHEIFPLYIIRVLDTSVYTESVITHII